MINDKTAQMAVNTIRAYCDEKKCDTCAIFDMCKLTNGRFRYSNGYDTVETFEGVQKSTEKPPKFDVALCDSHLFLNYMERVAEEEAEKVGLIFIEGTPLKDLMKARQYLDFLIANEEVKEKEHEKHD